MDNHRRQPTTSHQPGQEVVLPPGAHHPHGRPDILIATASPFQHDGSMAFNHVPPPSNPVPAFSSPAESTLSSSLNHLPPRYDSHQFPPTPPALHTSDPVSGSYFEYQHGAAADQLALSYASWSPSEQPRPHVFGSRFPRWGSWLEKRALERHYAQLDSQASSQHVAPSSRVDPPNRKKSWGAWVDGPDAINDDANSAPAPQNIASMMDASSLPPLHVHHYGSRFIPHLPAQPLCSVLVELPPSVHHRDKSSLAPRQVLLVGTALGLFAVQIRQPQDHSYSRQTQDAPPSPSTTSKQWNDNIRCIHVLSGIAVYQMCMLASKVDAAAAKSRMSQPNSTAISGVFLALTCPSSARDGLFASSLMQLSAHAGSVLENVAASGTFTSSSSNLSHNGHGISNPNEGVAAANFGPTAGGGPRRAVPPGGSGVLRMWHLQSIRELLLYALDRNDAQLPIDLASSSESSEDRRGGLGAMFRKTFSRQKARSQPRKPAHECTQSESSLSATIDPMPRPSGTTMSSSASQHSSTGFGVLPQLSRGTTFRHDPRGSGSPRTSPPATKRQIDPAHAAAVSLATSSVPIQPPAHSSAASHNSTASFTSLFADDLVQSFSGSRNGGTKGKEREASSQAASKGVLFFSVHEAATDTKASGTWYLAITYARTVMVYEAAVPRHGTTRAWSFVKELYAPFLIKAVTFAPAAVDDQLHPFASLSSLPVNAGPTKLRVATADGPLSISKKAPSNRETSSMNGSARMIGASSPTKTTPVSAAPTSWHKADLCLLLSFGRRAVLVRLRDSDVRELELKPLAQLIAASDASDSGSTTQLSLQPQSRRSFADPQSRINRSRPASMLSESDPPSDALPAGAPTHSRSGSVEHKLREAILDKRSNKHNWIGFSTIEAQVLVRQWSDKQVDPPHDVSDIDHWPRMEGSGLSPMGMSIAKASPGQPALSPQVLDKDLPRVPAPQNASFDRRMSRLHLSEQSSLYHDEVQADSSSDSDDGVSTVDARERAAKYQLRDLGPLPQADIRNQPPMTGKARIDTNRTPKRSSSLPPSESISVKVALASRGSLTHVLQLPLASNLMVTPPLAVMQWTDVPNAVSGWARVLGVERASSTGPTPLSHLSQSTAVSSASGTLLSSLGQTLAAQPKQGAPSLNPGRKSHRLILHVGVTCAAFLASRIEARKVSFRVPVNVDFDVSSEHELELIPTYNEAGYKRANGGTVQKSMPDTETYRRLSDDDTTSVGDGWRADPSKSQPFAYPSVQTFSSDRLADRSHSEVSALSLELEYLCAPLLTLNPIDLAASSCGAQSLVLPLSQATRQEGAQGGTGSESAAHALFPELGGDAGVIAFDWRGADDFRLFTLGIAG